MLNTRLLCYQFSRVTLLISEHDQMSLITTFPELKHCFTWSWDIPTEQGVMTLCLAPPCSIPSLYYQLQPYSTLLITEQWGGWPGHYSLLRYASFRSVSTVYRRNRGVKSSVEKDNDCTIHCSPTWPYRLVALGEEKPYLESGMLMVGPAPSSGGHDPGLLWSQVWGLVTWLDLVPWPPPPWPPCWPCWDIPDLGLLWPCLDPWPSSPDCLLLTGITALLLTNLQEYSTKSCFSHCSAREDIIFMLFSLWSVLEVDDEMEGTWEPRLSLYIKHLKHK